MASQAKARILEISEPRPSKANQGHIRPCPASVGQGLFFVSHRRITAFWLPHRPPRCRAGHPAPIVRYLAAGQ